MFQKKSILSILTAFIITLIISSCKKHTLEPEEYSPDLPRSISCITVKDSFLYIGTWGGGIFKFNTKTGKAENFLPPDYNNYWVRSIAIDTLGKIWVGTYNNLYIFDERTWTTVTGFNGDYASRIIKDKNHNIWFTSYKVKYNFFGRMDEGRGIIKFDGQSFTTYNPFGLANFSALTFDLNNNLWCGSSNFNFTEAFVVKYDGQNWTIFDSSNSNFPKIYGIYSMGIDKSNNVWIGGSEKDGIFKFDGVNVTIYNKNNSILPFNRADDIVVDKSGNVWFALYDVNAHDGALAKFDGNNWTIYRKDNSGLPSNYVRALAVDENGVLWIGTDVGLVRYDGITWFFYK